MGKLKSYQMYVEVDIYSFVFSCVEINWKVFILGNFLNSGPEGFVIIQVFYIHCL